MRIPFLLLAITTLASAQYKNLWPGEAPGARQPPAGTETANDKGHLSNIEVPQYQVYLPEKDKATGAAVVILPGGGYGIVAIQHEGHELAEWFAERGIAGIVVKYRVGPALGYQFPVPFLDARRAVRTVRANAAEWNIDPKKVGIMGFSAGGHLASLVTTRFNDSFPEFEGGDATDKLSARPDFSILIYPVISMDQTLGHGGSRKNLLGDNPAPEQIEKYSTDKAVTKETPPVFLLTTCDDFVDCRNSLQFAAACKANKVPVSLHLFQNGGHGYGLHGKGDVQEWPSLLDQWVKARGYAK